MLCMWLALKHFLNVKTEWKTGDLVENGFISLVFATRKSKIHMLTLQLSSFVTSDKLLCFSKLQLPCVQSSR